MANKPFVGFGIRRGFIYELDQYGHPAAPNTDPYVGLNIYGIRAFNLTDPPARVISHFDGDKVAQQQTFPPTDASTGSITIDGSDLDLSALVGAVKKTTISGIEILPSMTDQRGSEPLVGILVYQAAKDSSGNHGWHTRIVPKTTAIKQDGSFGESNYETTYNLAPSASDSHLWGTLFTDTDDGTEHSGWVEAFSPYPAIVTSFQADGIEDTFAFDASFLPPDTNYKVYIADPGTDLYSVAGEVSEVTSGITKGLTNIVFAVAPDDGAIIMVPHRFTV